MKSRCFKLLWALSAVALPLALIPSPPCSAKDIQFSGYTWHVRSGDNGGPGPNDWSADNVSVDARGRLHLKIADTGGKWTCAELWTDKRLGFGKYEFDVDSSAETLDDNVVLGLFNYTEPDIGPDGTNEIDIEFATWGGVQKVHGNWTVWPAKAVPTHGSHIFRFPVDHSGDCANSFEWSRDAVKFDWADSVPGGTPMRHFWTYAPDDASTQIPQHPLPVHINLWLFKGKPPTDDKEVEVVISAFRFTPGNGQ